VKATQTQLELPGVPRTRGTKRGREVPEQWEWTEASVWNERMLTTLERGIKGGQWYSLIDKSSALAQCLLRRTRADLLSHGPGPSESTSNPKPLTGEPDAGNPPVRFGGRGEVLLLVPTPIPTATVLMKMP
jgi:hypothetical protein